MWYSFRDGTTFMTAARYSILSKSAAVKSASPRAWIARSVARISSRRRFWTTGFLAISRSTQHKVVALVSWPASKIVLKELGVDESHCKARYGTHRICANISSSVRRVLDSSEAFALTTMGNFQPNVYYINTGLRTCRAKIKYPYCLCLAEGLQPSTPQAVVLLRLLTWLYDVRGRDF